MNYDIIEAFGQIAADRSDFSRKEEISQCRG
jgi:hypothetical protein